MKITTEVRPIAASEFGAISIKVEGVPGVSATFVRSLAGQAENPEWDSRDNGLDVDEETEQWVFSSIVAKHPVVMAALHRLQETRDLGEQEIAYLLFTINIFWD